MSRERLLAKTFVELADALVDGVDVIELLDPVAAGCIRLFDAAACGMLLADTDGHLQVIATSSEQEGLLELLRLQNDEGPCLETFHTGRAVVNAHLDTAIDEWPRFATAAQDAGYASVQAVPRRLRFQVIGALNLFHADARESSLDDLALAQALADVATIGLLQTLTRHPEAATRRAAAGGPEQPGHHRAGQGRGLRASRGGAGGRVRPAPRPCPPARAAPHRLRAGRGRGRRRGAVATASKRR